MPNVPLAHELEALAPVFFEQLVKPVREISGPKPVPVDAPEVTFSGVDTRSFLAPVAHEADPATTIHGRRRPVPGTPRKSSQRLRGRAGGASAPLLLRRRGTPKQGVMVVPSRWRDAAARSGCALLSPWSRNAIRSVRIARGVSALDAWYLVKTATCDR
jgi:hypothetical protein